MKIKTCLWLSALCIALSALLPLSAEACGKCGGTGGIIYSNVDLKYHSIPGERNCMVYRGVDDQLLPVGSDVRYCRTKHHARLCKHRVISVQCQVRPAHWMGSSWMPESNECYYVGRNLR